MIIKNILRGKTIRILKVQPMGTVGNRLHERKRCCLQAFVTNIYDTYQIKCTIRDVSEQGCKIVSSQIHELPEDVLVIPEGFEKPLRAKVVWRSEKMAGLRFADFDQTETTRSGDLRKQTENGPPDEDITDLTPAKQTLGYAARLQRIRARS